MDANVLLLMEIVGEGGGEACFWSLAVCKTEPAPFLHAASDQKLEPGKAWERG